MMPDDGLMMVDYGELWPTMIKRLMACHGLQLLLSDEWLMAVEFSSDDW